MQDRKRCIILCVFFESSIKMCMNLSICFAQNVCRNICSLILMTQCYTLTQSWSAEFLLHSKSKLKQFYVQERIAQIRLWFLCKHISDLVHLVCAYVCRGISVSTFVDTFLDTCVDTFVDMFWYWSDDIHEIRKKCTDFLHSHTCL